MKMTKIQVHVLVSLSNNTPILCGFVSVVVILCTPRSTLRQWMLAARDEGLTKGDFGFIFANQELPTDTLYNSLTSDTIYKGNDGRGDDAKQAFQSLLIVRLHSHHHSNYFYNN